MIKINEVKTINIFNYRVTGAIQINLLQVKRAIAIGPGQHKDHILIIIIQVAVTERSTGRTPVLAHIVIQCRVDEGHRRAIGIRERGAVVPFHAIDLDEGPRMMSRIVDAAPESVAVGAAVDVKFEDWGAEHVLPVFSLRESQDHEQS